MLDGQQRTISICRYLDGKISADNMTYFNLTREEQEQVLDYKLMIYICEGTTKEKLDWFETINIAGEKLTAQERNNAIFSGTWVSDARKRFSRNGCPAEKEARDYIKGSPIRQDYLETAIFWAASHCGIEGKRETMIVRYMSKHHHDETCLEMWQHFRNVTDWVRFTFPVCRRKYMQGIEWGLLFDFHGGKNLNPCKLEEKIQSLLADDDVTRKQGVYEYVLDGDERHLHIRQFPDRDKRSAYERQKGICAMCGEHFEIGQMEADHIIAWSRGGHTEPSNCQVLCRKCNRKKGNN